jgi:glycosyltransferase involved in cell wall biosynthesis
MEAAATGLPIVATDIRGCRQVVEHDVTGLLVPVGDPAMLRTAITGLARRPDTRSAMGRAARRKAEREFDERDVVSRVVTCYAAVAARKGIRWAATRPGSANAATPR